MKIGGKVDPLSVFYDKQLIIIHFNKMHLFLMELKSSTSTVFKIKS